MGALVRFLDQSAMDGGGAVQRIDPAELPERPPVEGEGVGAGFQTCYPLIHEAVAGLTKNGDAGGR